MAHYLLKGSTYLTSLQSCITQQQQVRRNIFAYSDRGGFSLSFGYVYVKFEPRPKKLLAVKDENLGLILCLVRGHPGMAFDSAVLVSSMH